MLFTEAADKDFDKLDKPIKQKIISFFEERILVSPNPRSLGKRLQGSLKEFWSYRIGDYRVLTLIQDEEFTILAIRIAHRRHVYK